MASLNQCQFIGNLGKEPEIRYSPDGKAIASFSIACSEKWKDKQSGETKESTEWVNISAFGRLAEIIGEYLTKGSKVYISGRMKTDKYTDKSGIEKYSTKIIANQMIMLDSRGAATDNSAPQSTPAGSATIQDDPFGDDLPFMSYEYKAIA